MIHAQLPNVHLTILQHVHPRKKTFLLLPLLFNSPLLLSYSINVWHLHFLSNWFGSGLSCPFALSCFSGLSPVLAISSIIKTFSPFLEFRRWFDGLLFHEVLNGCQALGGVRSKGVDFLQNGLDINGAVVLFSEIGDDGGEVEVLLLHLLVMAATLLGLSCSHEHLHRLEDLVHATHVTVHKVTVVDLQEPVVSLVLLQRPMPTVHDFHLLLAATPTTTFASL